MIDLAQIAAYGLSIKATRLIEVIALWEIASLLDNGLRLRSMCDLTPKATTANLPAAPELTEEIASLTAELRDELSNGEVLTVKWTGGSGKKAVPNKKKSAENAEVAADEPEDD